MDIEPIKTKRDYLRALKEVEPLMDARRGTPEGSWSQIGTMLA